MGTTPRFGLGFPELTDEPNGPAQLSALATDVDGWLARALPCTSTTRPDTPDTGLMIFETDTGLVQLWDGTDWSPIASGGGGGGGGGSGTTGGAQFSGAAQSVPHATDTACGFPTTDVASPHVTRQAYGAGHQFVLETSGLWTVTATVRYAAGGGAGERYAGIHLPGGDGGTPLAGQGPGTAAAGAVTDNITVCRPMSSGTAIFVNLWQGSGSARALEPGAGGGWVRINLSVVA